MSEGGERQQIELVFGLVGPTGVDQARVCTALRDQLRAVGYEPLMVRLSELLAPYLHKPEPALRSEYERIEALMAYGNELRSRTQQPDIAARLGIAAIRALREERSGSVNTPLPRAAYIIRSFKRPEEVELFRTVYGSAFTLVSVYATKQARTEFLAQSIGPAAQLHDATPQELAARLIARDYEEEDHPLGQRVGRTFPLADFFVSAEPRPALAEQLRRLVRLTFGDPYISPTRDEQAMFFAQAAALRSLDLSRQVGAAIVTMDGDVVTTGCNEVARAGGGLYWADDPDRDRDYERGSDSNVLIKREIIEETIKRLRDEHWLDSDVAKRTDRELANDAVSGDRAFMRRSRLFDVIEFGRAVHAEMAAISQAARRGAALQGTRLFCTTFPCHICARHIVSAGIRDVVFIEPYEKSRTQQLYADSISIEPTEPSPSRVNFRAFVGVAPRRYIDLFQLQSERKTKQGGVLDSGAIAASPRVKAFVFSYLSAEDLVVSETSDGSAPAASEESRSE